MGDSPPVEEPKEAGVENQPATTEQPVVEQQPAKEQPRTTEPVVGAKRATVAETEAGAKRATVAETEAEAKRATVAETDVVRESEGVKVEEEPQPYKATFEKQFLIKDDLLRAAYAVYKPSKHTLTLDSEKNRTLISEDIEEKVDPRKIPTLKTMAMKVVAERFRSGDIPHTLSPNDKIGFCAMIDVDAPIMNLLKISNERFWRRLAEAKSKDQALIQSKINDRTTVWKNYAVQLKFEEIIEKASVEGWDDDNTMTTFTRKLSPFIYELYIKQLQSQSAYTFERDENLVTNKVYNYPSAECHHINLSFLGVLENLHTLVIEFNPPELGMNYQIRFFQFSYVDVENLAKGLITIESLKTFKIRRSSMDTTKLVIILNALKRLTVENLEFSFCYLQDESGIVLSNFLNTNFHVKSLELRGNYLQDNGIRALSYGIQEYEGKLSYLGLSFNPIKDNGLTFLARGLFNCLQVDSLDLSGIEITDVGSALIAAIITTHKLLKHVNLVGCPLIDKGGDRIIKAMSINRRIVKLQVRCCGLPLQQEFQLRILVNRNIYIKNNPYLYEEGEVLELMGKTDRIRASEEKKIEKNLLSEIVSGSQSEIVETVNIDVNESIENQDLNMDADKDLRSPTDDDEIRQWVARIKNPILLKSINQFKKQQDCKKLAEGKKFGERSSSSSSIYNPTKYLCNILESDSDLDVRTSQIKTEKLDLDYNELTEKEFMESVRVAGNCRKAFYK